MTFWLLALVWDNNRIWRLEFLAEGKCDFLISSASSKAGQGVISLIYSTENEVRYQENHPDTGG